MVRESQMPVCPADAIAAAERVAGSPACWTPIGFHWGSAVWRVEGHLGPWAVKVDYSRVGRIRIARQATALHRVHSSGSPAVAYGAEAVPGSTVACTWLLLPWFEGQSTRDVFQLTRSGGSDGQSAIKPAVELCRAVDQLHRAGWVHGDLHPRHMLHTEGGIRLLDCSTAWSAELPPPSWYRGGLVHFMPPRFARAVEGARYPIRLSQSDEVYSLAASLWWAMAGEWPLDYAAAGIDPEKMEDAALRGVIASGDISVRRPTTGYQVPLYRVLTEHPHPVSAEQLGDWLSTVSEVRPAAGDGRTPLTQGTVKKFENAELLYELRDRHIVVTAAGDLAVYEAPTFREILRDLVNDGRVSGDLILDLRAVRLLDSTCLGVIVGAMKILQSQHPGRVVRIVAQDSHSAHKAWRATGLAMAIELHENPAEALAAADSPPAERSAPHKPPGATPHPA